MLLYDRETESLWSQIKQEAVTGPLTGTPLKPVASTLTTWKRWRKKHPDTLVLSTETGYRRDYTSDPYRSYHRSPFAFFGLKKKLPHLPEKELVAGVEIDGVKKAYPFSVLKGSGPNLTDTVSGKRLTVNFDIASEEVTVTGQDNETLPVMVSYWFVWYSFNPDTLIFSP